VSAVRLVIGVVCVALAVIAVLLARDVWHWGDAMRDGDLRAETRPVRGVWTVDETLPFGVAHELLGVDDDREFRELVARGSKMTGRAATDEEVRARVPVKSALARLSRDESDPGRASAAANLLGVIYMGDPDEPDRPAAEKALAEFQKAARLDPGNEAAKENVELILQQQSDESLRGRSAAGGGEQAGRGAAGLAKPGHGY
jgi:hypothetical protein